ncbi:hypothetical protein [Breoghania sp. L-A4]|uniref:hypothetical protein n=1 Tax=Breoghania sp. L-A4 TaxID=2304600 RepID=UPI000E3581F9|nr:hypothetical protein [Breoghania sp. L-A4]AXS40987.1 hypothetical protein D1F64_14325 [Breoghania sp. L-A4]
MRGEPFIGAHAVRLETGAEYVRLCLPRDGTGPRLDRTEIERLRGLLTKAEAELDSLPDDGQRHVVPILGEPW